MKEHPNLPLEPTYTNAHNLKNHHFSSYSLKNHHFPAHIPLLPLKIQIFNGYISHFQHFLITISSKYIANMKEHPNLPLEPTYNQPPYPT